MGAIPAAMLKATWEKSKSCVVAVAVPVANKTTALTKGLHYKVNALSLKMDMANGGEQQPCENLAKVSSGPSDTQKSQGNTPMDEGVFIHLVSDAQEKSKSSENDMQKGGIKAARDKGVCGVLKKKLEIKNWIGKVDNISANSDGEGVLGIEISEDVIITTWNNDISDSSDNTLLDPESQLFKSASGLKVGQPVHFSGAFRLGGCWGRVCQRK